MERYYQPEIETASREQIKAWQDERLVKQVRHVWDNVPYYRKKMEEKGLIRTEPSTIITKDGRVRNGSLIYTIRPIQEALELNYERQLLQAELDTERLRVEKHLAELNQRRECDRA